MKRSFFRSFFFLGRRVVALLGRFRGDGEGVWGGFGGVRE